MEKKVVKSVVLILPFLLTPACDDDPSPGIFIVGLQSDGAIDTGFGEAGWVFANPTEGSVQAAAADIDGQDRIAIGGCSHSSEHGTENIVLLFSEVGTPTRSFGTDGLYRTTTPTFCTGGLAVNRINNALVTDYYLLSADVPRRAFGGSTTSLVLQRLDFRGRPDREFSGDGTTEVIFEPEFWDSGDCPRPSARCLIDHELYPVEVVVDGDDRPIVLGHIEINDIQNTRRVSKQVVVRFLPNGAIDTTFGEGGRLIHDWNLHRTSPSYDLAVNETAATAIISAMNGSGTGQIGVFRITERGQPDPFFGVDGMAFDHLHDPSVSVSTRPIDVKFDDRGGIVVGGQARIDRPDRATQDRFIVLRFGATGRDPAFGSGGVAWISFPGFEIPIGDTRGGLAVDESGRIVVAAAGREGNRVFVARLDRLGTLDRSFGTDGRVVLSVPGGDPAVASVLLGDGGSVRIVGHTSRP